MSGGTAGQSVVGISDGIVSDGQGVEVSAFLIAPTSDTTKREAFHVRVSPLSDGTNLDTGTLQGSINLAPVLPAKQPQMRVLESFVPILPAVPLAIRLFRDNADVRDNWTGSTGIMGIRVRAVNVSTPATVRAADAYNSWPMLLSASGRLVCIYSSGAQHTLPDTTRSVYRHVSTDNGATWSAVAVMVDTAGVDDAATGCGLDASGNMLVWVRRNGLDSNRTHHLYRSTDGGYTWSLIASPTFGTLPLQIASIFSVPTVGLMALWHGGTYGGSSNSWGIVKSDDNGLSWTQVVVESGLAQAAWPTELAGVYVGSSGRILAMGRTEIIADASSARALFQLQSDDYGDNWTKVTSNVTDIIQSTPALIYDAVTGKVDLYYWHRNWGACKRRNVLLSTIWGNATAWPSSSAVATGSLSGPETGIVNAVLHNGEHKIAYYSGLDPNTGIYVATAAP
jgi:hypothetical protein